MISLIKAIQIRKNKELKINLSNCYLRQQDLEEIYQLLAKIKYITFETDYMTHYLISNFTE